MKNKNYTFVLWITAAALLVAGCSGLAAQAAPTEEPEPVDDFIPLVSATGVVVPSQFSTLSVSTAGIVEDVIIEEGDLVAADQALLLLKGKEDLEANIAAAEYEITLAQKALDDLDETATDASVVLLELIGVLAKSVRDAQYQLDNLTIPANQEDLEAIVALDKKGETLDLARAAYEPYRLNAEEQENKELNCAINRSWTKSPSECKVEETTEDVLKDELDDAQSDYDNAVRRLQFETTLELLQEQLAKAREDYALYNEGPDPADVAVAMARLKNAEASIAASQALYDDLEVNAPFDGTISELYINESEWIAPGQPALLLADLENLRIETTDLSEIDVSRIKLGDEVIITFDALPDFTTAGTVARISPKASSGAGVNYTVVIELQEIPDQLRWGMTAFVDIELE